MNRTRIEFLAMPEEQLRWLQELLKDGNIWCVLQIFPPNPRIEQVSGSEFLADLPLRKADEMGGLQLFFGRRDLVPAPIWRMAENGDHDIDFVRSQAIQYCPSVVVASHVLLSGQMAIMGPMHYKDAKVDSKLLRMWFQKIVKSFDEMKAVDTVFFRDVERGEETKYLDVVATSGAIEWQRTGHILKQFLNGVYEFYIQVKD